MLIGSRRPVAASSAPSIAIGGVDVRPLDTELASHRDQPVDAWVSFGVLAVSEAGESTPILSTCGDDIGGGSAAVGSGLRAVGDLGDHAHGVADCGGVELAHGEQTRGRAGLERSAARDDRSSGEHGGCSGAVVDGRHHEGVEQSGSCRGRELAGIQEVDHRAERGGTDEVEQVIASDLDSVGGRLRQGRHPTLRAQGGATHVADSHYSYRCMIVDGPGGVKVGRPAPGSGSENNGSGGRHGCGCAEAL